MIEVAVDFLIETQNADGGWGTVVGKHSNAEATAFTILSLAALKEETHRDGLSRAVAWLADRQNPDGSWPLTAALKDGSWATALAVLSLAAFEKQRARAVRGADWLLSQKGSGLGLLNSLLYRFSSQQQKDRLNPDLKGWSWTPGTFSWVEPTAYALLALKKLRAFLPAQQVEDRIRQGELLLYDRVCEEGGWNYGNTKILGANLWPYPDTTALALIALEEHRTREANQRSLEALRRMLAQTQSGLALSWSILCFTLYGEDVSRWRQLLAECQKKTGFLGETKTMALALLASVDNYTVFKV
ncbi:MAG: hypothetical protein HY236_04865 [Acidobacteria bacterium]|nr:hypothetical protein [Acidobacteriota bacterium]